MMDISKIQNKHDDLNLPKVNFPFTQSLCSINYETVVLHWSRNHNIALNTKP